MRCSLELEAEAHRACLVYLDHRDLRVRMGPWVLLGSLSRVNLETRDHQVFRVLLDYQEPEGPKEKKAVKDQRVIEVLMGSVSRDHQGLLDLLEPSLTYRISSSTPQMVPSTSQRSGDHQGPWVPGDRREM